MERLTRASSQVSNFKHLMYAKCARFDKSKQFESRHDPHMKLKKIRKIFKIKWRKKNSIHSSTNKTLSWSGNSNSDIRCRSNRWLRDGGWSGSRGGWKNSFLSLFANRCERRIVFIYFFFAIKLFAFSLPWNFSRFSSTVRGADGKHNIFSKAYEHDVFDDEPEQPTKSRSLFFASISFSVLFLWKFIVFIFSHSLLYIFGPLSLASFRLFHFHSFPSPSSSTLSFVAVFIHTQ